MKGIRIQKNLLLFEIAIVAKKNWIGGESQDQGHDVSFCDRCILHSGNNGGGSTKSKATPPLSSKVELKVLVDKFLNVCNNRSLEPLRIFDFKLRW